MTAETMRAIVFDGYGDASVLREARLPCPVPQPGQMLVRVRAVGVNPADGKWRSGMFARTRPLQFPQVPGYDVAGEVVHSEDAAMPPGTRVAAMLDALVQGAYAEYAAVAPRSAAPIPDTLSFETAAALPTPGLTGVQLIEEQLDVQPGETVLLTGATGAVGRFALHAARARGARVVAAVRAKHVDTAIALGAAQAIVLGEQAWTGAPFDHVADTVGGALVADLCRQVRPSGRIRTVSTTPIPAEGLPCTPGFFGVHADADRLARLAQAAGAGALDVAIAARFPLAQAADAQRLVDAGSGGGKVVLIP